LTRQIVVALALPAVAHASIVWRGDFETGNTSQWSTRQAVSDDRLLVVTSPHRQGNYALRATVKDGDDPINASGNRNELAYLSLEPEGSESYYSWSTMFADDYPSLNSGQVVTQFHQNEDSGNPPITFYTEGEEFRFYVNGHAPGLTFPWDRMARFSACVTKGSTRPTCRPLSYGVVASPRQRAMP
jgi:hypothetical protein